MSATTRRCAGCGAEMVPAGPYARSAELRRRYARHACRGLCSRCWWLARRDGRLDDYERRTVSRDEVLAEWEWLRSDGSPLDVAAQRMGMTTAALDRALHRALRAGDERARHACVKTRAAA